jgi:hypothetical protein
LSSVASLAVPVAANATTPPSYLQPGKNDGISDSLVGPHDWKFSARPGTFQLVISLGTVPANSLPGAPFTCVLHVVPLSATHITFKKVPGGYIYAGRIMKPVSMRLAITPPYSPLVRESTTYTVEASGSIAFSTGPDPIIGTYMGPNGLGAVKFQSGGRVLASTGDTGTWTLFDPDLHVYTVVVGQTRWSLRLVPGQGLDDAGNGNITFETAH